MTSSKLDGSTAFGGFAAVYARWRPGYPRSVYDALLAALDGPRRHAVDLGAGSGQATKDLAKFFNRVTAVEPDAQMLAAFSPPQNVEIANLLAEEATFAASSVDAVIAATSFHWMKQSDVAARAFEWLRPGGVFFPFRFGAFQATGAARPVLERHAALWEPYKDRRLTANIEYQKPVLATGLFHSVISYSDEASASLSVDEAAGLFGTTSFASAYARAACDSHEDYVNLLAAELRAAGEAIILRAPIKGAIAIKAHR